MLIIIWAGWVKVAEIVELHPFASVTVTVYIAAVNPVAVAVDCPPGVHR
jgi:hypothetical protein